MTFLRKTALIFLLGLSAAATAQIPVRLTVDAARDLGELTPIWAWFGYDEPNYTYMKDGKKLLTELSALSKVPVNVRVHSLLVTGDGTAALKWGSTNAYTEDASGKPVYDWTITDRIFDTFIQRGMKPIAQIGFMPEALSTRPVPYRHHWKPGDNYNDIYTGWAYPPKDYSKWAELVYQWVRHCVDRYGKKEVETWYWELWNEPDIGYWKGTPEEFLKLYDYTADAVKRALPTARIGGPEVTGPNGRSGGKMLKQFLDHVTTGTNYATGKTGSPVDVLTFHAKGAPKLVDGVVQMNMGTQLRDIDKGMEIIAGYPSLKHLPVIIGESDPEGCAACSEDLHPQNAYRNGTMYASYTAASFARKYDIAASRGILLAGAVTWAFEFENQAWFRGFRDLATNGVDKPVLNVFRMFGMMGRRRLPVAGGTYDFQRVKEQSVRAEPDINALASREEKSVTVLVWHYHDDHTAGPSAGVELKVDHLPSRSCRIEQFRVDADHSNSYEAWKKMGSPKSPTAGQVTTLEKAGQLEKYEQDRRGRPTNGTLSLKVELPRQGVSLLRISWP